VSDANVVNLLHQGRSPTRSPRCCATVRAPDWPKRSRPRLAEFLTKHADLTTTLGLSRVVRHGHLPEREVMTGIGPVGVRQPRCATVALPMMPGAFASHPRSCRRMRGAPGAGSILVARSPPRLETTDLLNTINNWVPSCPSCWRSAVGGPCRTSDDPLRCSRGALRPV